MECLHEHGIVFGVRSYGVLGNGGKGNPKNDVIWSKACVGIVIGEHFGGDKAIKVKEVGIDGVIVEEIERNALAPLGIGHYGTDAVGNLSVESSAK